MPKKKKKNNKNRGFASMSPERRLAIATLGGQRAQASGKAHKWTSKEATIASKLGVEARNKKRKQKK